MSNLEAIRRLAATVTAEHYFSNVSDFARPSFETFEVFVNYIDTEIRDGNGDKSVAQYYDGDDDDAPIAWEPFEDYWMENLRGMIAATHNNILRTSASYGLVTEDEVAPYFL